MNPQKDWSWVPRRDWEWNEGSQQCGVHTWEGKLVWWSRPFGPTGYMFENGMEQSFQEFLETGQPVSAPREVVDELVALLTVAESPNNPMRPAE